MRDAVRLGRLAGQSDPDLNPQFRRPRAAVIAPLRPIVVTGPERPLAPAHPLAIHDGPRHRAPTYRTARQRAAAEISAR